MTGAQTKARTQAGKRRARDAQRAMQQACALSGVVISASAVDMPEAPGDAMQTVLENRCRRMGWPLDDAHRAKARHNRFGTLYGRLWAADRLDEDAFLGIEAWDRLDRACAQVKGYRRVVPNDYASKDQEPDADFIAAERDAAWAMLRGLGVQHAQLVTAALDSEADRWPSDWPIGYDAQMREAGHALARHFGLRA